MDMEQGRLRALGKTLVPGGALARVIAGLVALLVLGDVALSLLWSNEPSAFDVRENARSEAARSGRSVVVGSTTTAALIRVADTLLDKPGGYLSNDVLPPGVLLDNMPNWEFGALVQVRDLAKAMRETLSRSQSQSKEDPDLVLAEPQFNFDSESWILPATESEYASGVQRLRSYARRLADPGSADAQFYARADNLRYWLNTVQTRLGSLSQRLSASVGKAPLQVGVATPDATADRSAPGRTVFESKTPWYEIDDIFYEARGSTWALLHFLKAVEVDFADVLERKNAAVSLRQIIRELEGTQQPMRSPLILNGSGFGPLANHSLVMASYISRANAGVIDLRELLAQG